ncbi:MAG: phosphoglycerate mutase family protein [Alphaproteobacteria bacterium]|nr:phosphoglycerate mutase family protein [Alphaproteobacteria bacterium]MBU1513558.1 phosphoglycerate mutase family protein [Alphaproteobacteria bacterium]MBU2094797.1 phosphoglycerate mutase family protein [Alphaproteobacteria bacterium]MBU2150134.1 phosphoglycerate mutase family protein [Alphaproteobacteria bacterium]MBU2309337.1 phosphoglycerate mutase family protein [Alphaproteobacteria bacterium]
MARLYLIRHGKPSATWGGHDDDPGLDEMGQAQARAARDWLLSRPGNERPTLVVSSPLRRCRETAEPTAQALGVAVEIDPVVGEIPTPKALTGEERPAWLRNAFQGTWQAIDGDMDYDAWRTDIIASLAARGHTAVFSHYVAINAAVSRLLGVDEVLAFKPDHTSITVLETDGQTVQLIEKGAEATTGVL